MTGRALLKNCLALATMDEALGEMRGASLLIEGREVRGIGEAGALLDQFGRADAVFDMSAHVVIPGMVNTHHHFFQNLTRAWPAGQDTGLFGWLKSLYPVWSKLNPEALAASTKLACAELLLSGCTTSSDHLYLYPDGCRLDDSIAAAAETGMRFHATRGSMSVGESEGGLPPDAVVEDEDAILADTERLIGAHHDPERLAMTRVAVAPCSPFTVSPELMRASAELARKHGVGLHTHTAETDDDVAHSKALFGASPAELAEDWGWTGDDVWHAHCVKLDERGQNLFARTGTGVAHCPCSNMRLGSGIAPIRAMLDRRVKVGLGVDGSSSNDSGHMLAEARQAMLLQRVALGAEAFSVREALRLATRGGASVLNRDDVGKLAPGMAADVAAFRVDGLAHAGAQHDPLAALLLCQPNNADLVMVNGKLVVEEGRLTTLDVAALLREHAAQVARLVA